MVYPGFTIKWRLCMARTEAEARSVTNKASARTSAEPPEAWYLRLGDWLERLVPGARLKLEQLES